MSAVISTGSMTLKLVVALGETSEFYRVKITGFTMCNGCGTDLKRRQGLL